MYVEHKRSDAAHKGVSKAYAVLCHDDAVLGRGVRVMHRRVADLAIQPVTQLDVAVAPPREVQLK